MKLKKLTASLGLALGLGLGIGGSAVAAPTFFFPTTIFEDDLHDFHIDRDAPGTPGFGKISAGDSVVSVLEINSTAPGSGPGGSVPILPPEFTGIADAFVLAFIPTGPPGSGIGTFIFGPNPGGFLAGVPGAPATATAGAPVGAIARFWDGPSPINLDVIGPNCVPPAGVLATCLTAASDGTLFFGFGFLGAPNEHFIITGASDDPATVKLFGPGVGLGSANFGFSFTENFSGVTFGQVDCASPFCPIPFGPKVDNLGSGDIKGGAGTTDGSFARGDFQFEVAPLGVPEPDTLALLGLGLAGLGLGGIRRRKFSV